MSRQYLPFVDWMKSVGMFLIVLGHVAGGPVNHLTPPIYPKQLGVAFFLFVVGFSLAIEKRATWEVVFKRLFEIYLFGIAIAILLSMVFFATQRSLNLSNYLPFLAGANVFFNHFPANPTTWYIGTYSHIVFIWACGVRRLRVSVWMLLVSVALEIVIRAALLASFGGYVAYMVVPNWATVFLLGTWSGQRYSESPGTGHKVHDSTHRVGWVVGFVLFAAMWAVLLPPLVKEYSFPFARFSTFGEWGDSLTTSIGVSAAYLMWTLLFYKVAGPLQTPVWVRFFARNTLIVFIAHMPVYYALDPILRRVGQGYLINALVQLSVCFVVLAVVSEFVRHVVRPRTLATLVAERILPHEPGFAVPSL